MVCEFRNGDLDMKTKAEDLPRDLGFIIEAVADITLDRYLTALERLREGAKLLLHSKASIGTDNWDFVISALENAVKHKLGTQGLIATREDGQIEHRAEPISLRTHEIGKLLSEAQSESSVTEGNPGPCSFCGKYRDEVGELIAGWGGYICDGCVEICNQILKPHPPVNS
jgi:hypothetical protein